jgi:S-formylglutathione hydrolase FrmB
MKKYILLFFVIQMTFSARGQNSEGHFIFYRLYSSRLENPGGEGPTRRVSVYVPPGYDETIDRFPVIYLHGITQSDSSLIAENKLDKLLNKAIVTGKVRPLIFVMCDQYTLYRRSFYTNSSLTGNWADFTAKDLVGYVDQNYGTIPDRESRGISGHSMGGHGALKLALLFPDVFASVYALSPYVLGLEKDYGMDGNAYKQAQEIKSRDSLFKHLNASAVIDVGRSFSPNPNKPPFYADLPYTYEGDSLIINYKVLELWNRNLPLEMASTYANNLKKLKAIKFDWGNNDFFTHIPPTCRAFDQKLEALGIRHVAEEYVGSHIDKVYGDDGRFINDMLPFFNSYLNFE